MLENLERTEDELATHASFGDVGVVLPRTAEVVRAMVDDLAIHHPEARRFAERLRGTALSASHRVLLDPVIRTRIQAAALAQMRNALSVPSGLATLLEVASASLEGDRQVSPLEVDAPEPHYLGEPPLQTLLWDEGRAEDFIASQYRRLYATLARPGIALGNQVLQEMPAASRTRLVEAESLARMVLPKLTPSLLAHVRVLAVLGRPNPDTPAVGDEDEWISFSLHPFFGAIWVSAKSLANPWVLAESLIHEAAHNKLSDLVVAGEILTRKAFASPELRVPAWWNTPGPDHPIWWAGERVLFAGHAYAHIGLFYRKAALLLERGEALPPGMEAGPLATKARKALDKSRYLLRCLMNLAGDELLDEGWELTRWLAGAVESIDPHPPRRDPTLSLLLERFDRETPSFVEELAKIPDMLASDVCVSELIRSFVGEQIAFANRIHALALEEGGKGPPPPYKNDVVHHLVGLAPMAGLLQETRRWVSDSLAAEGSLVGAEPSVRITETVVELVDHGRRCWERMRARLRVIQRTPGFQRQLASGS
ncbi:hypothetical protein Pan216_10500 [Planctomycetes bacterium Pan216]|uniref:HEXXH motif domain protein n=1 Tax=Kolteria novifilia TaxID=2527975 RepID=A0A518AZS5_9BACT|nr:hypothetical protein Pan216_10500 [Planctomycetes bacterium Pan216]